MAFSDMLPLAAKASRQSRTEWLPLWMHLRDTAGVMEYLVNQWLPCSIKKVIFPQEEDPIRKIAVLLGATHDLGKATALFQSMILRNLDGVKERLQKMGLPISDNRIFRKKVNLDIQLLGSHFTGSRISPLVCFHRGESPWKASWQRIV